MNATRIVQVREGYGIKKIDEDLSALQGGYPELEVMTIGKSVLGHAIPAVRIGTGSKHIHYNGSFHANEWITSLLLMIFIEDLLQANRAQSNINAVNIAELLSACSLWVVPMVNPDGVDLVQNGFTADNNPFYRDILQANNGSTNFRNWKANIRGVDLNDQFPANWDREYNRRETAGPSPLNYPGPHPLSEPEAQAMAGFTTTHDFDLVMVFHTQGEEIYWGYDQKEPDESEGIIRKLQKVSGYRAVRYVESDAGYKDWFIAEWRRPGFTVECGSGQNPLPLSHFSSIYRQASAIMLAGMAV